MGETDNGGPTQAVGAEGPCYKVIATVACFFYCYFPDPPPAYLVTTTVIT